MLEVGRYALLYLAYWHFFVRTGTSDMLPVLRVKASVSGEIAVYKSHYQEGSPLISTNRVNECKRSQSGCRFSTVWSVRARAKTIEIQRQFTTILMNAQYGGIVPPSKWKSQLLIGKVIASLQRPLKAPVPIETWGCACTVISALELCMRTKISFLNAIWA